MQLLAGCIVCFDVDVCKILWAGSCPNIHGMDCSSAIGPTVADTAVPGRSNSLPPPRRLRSLWVESQSDPLLTKVRGVVVCKTRWVVLQGGGRVRGVSGVIAANMSVQHRVWYLVGVI